MLAVLEALRVRADNCQQKKDTVYGAALLEQYLGAEKTTSVSVILASNYLIAAAGRIPTSQLRVSSTLHPDSKKRARPLPQNNSQVQRILYRPLS